MTDTDTISSLDPTLQCCYLPPREGGYEGLSHAEVRKLGCQTRPRWILYTGWSPDDYTHSCEEHVATLLGADPLIEIEQLDVGILPGVLPPLVVA